MFFFGKLSVVGAYYYKTLCQTLNDTKRILIRFLASLTKEILTALNSNKFHQTCLIRLIAFCNYKPIKKRIANTGMSPVAKPNKTLQRKTNLYPVLSNKPVICIHIPKFAFYFIHYLITPKGL